MGRLIRQNLLDLAGSIDPREIDGTALTETTVCTAGHDGEKFTGQQLLDIYNRARLAFLTNLMLKEGSEGLFAQGGVVKPATGTIATVTTNTAGNYSTATGTFTAATRTLAITMNAAFTSGDVGKTVVFRVAGAVYFGIIATYVGAGSVTLLASTTLPAGTPTVDYCMVAPALAAETVYTITKPTDYVALISLTDLTKSSQIIILPPALYSEVVAGRNADLIESATTKQIYMFAIQNTFQNSDSAIAGDTYRLIYIGCTLWVLTNVDASTTETIEDNMWPIVHDLAVRIANEAGNAEVDALAQALLSGRRN
jgi:hypothetical protein